MGDGIGSISILSLFPVCLVETKDRPDPPRKVGSEFSAVQPEELRTAV